MSLILAISTSSKIASVSLVKSGSMLAEPMTHEEKSHTASLMPMIDELFSSFAITCDDIDCFAVDTGPGSFTGVRIGVATANGMALGANKPVIGINSLLALRYQQLEISPVVTMIDAHNENVYAAIYFSKHATLAPCAMTIDELIEKMPKGALCIGDGAAAYQQRILEAHPSAKFATDDNGLVHASCVGLAAWHMIEEDKSLLTGGSMFAFPTYLKLSQAERVREEQREEEECETEEDIHEAETDGGNKDE